MKFKTIAIAALLAVSVAGPAAAGNATLKKGDSKMKLFCNGSGCFTQDVLGAFKLGKKNRIGPGGRQNFLAHKAKFQAKGWK